MQTEKVRFKIDICLRKKLETTDRPFATLGNSRTICTLTISSRGISGVMPNALANAKYRFCDYGAKK